MNYEDAWKEQKRWLNDSLAYLGERIADTGGAEQARLNAKREGILNSLQHMKETEKIYRGNKTRKLLFKPMTLARFNRWYNKEAVSSEIEAFTDYLEDAGMRYFYASYDQEDVERALADEEVDADFLTFIMVDDVYLALY